jgi:hypothetical protein
MALPPPPAGTKPVASVFGRAQDATPAGAARLAAVLWGAAGRGDAFWGEFMPCLNHLLTVAPVREGEGVGDGRACRARSARAPRRGMAGAPRAGTALGR